MKLNGFLFALTLVTISHTATANPGDMLKSVLDQAKKDFQPERVAPAPPAKPEMAVPAAAPAVATAKPSKIFGVDEVGSIPRQDGEDDKGRPDNEAKDFAANWKGKTISIRGKVNRGGGLSLDLYQIYGCESILKSIKPNTPTVVTGTLDSRERGGSGGEPVGLTNCRLYDEKAGVDAGTATKVASPVTSMSVDDNEINVGYLKNTVKIFDGAGCEYILAQDDKKKGDHKPVAADDYYGKGIVLNINGQDLLVVGSNGKTGFTGKADKFQVSIPNGKQRSCGEECAKTLTTIVINKGSVKKSTPVVAYCGS